MRGKVWQRTEPVHLRVPTRVFRAPFKARPLNLGTGLLEIFVYYYVPP